MANICRNPAAVGTGFKIQLKGVVWQKNDKDIKAVTLDDLKNEDAKSSKKLSRKEKKAKKDKPAKQPATPKDGVPEFMTLSGAGLFIRSFLTAGLYLAYWNHKQWNALKHHEGFEARTVWRGIFSIFFIVQLLGKIRDYEKSNKIEESYSVSFIGGTYIVVLLISNSFARIEEVGFGILAAAAALLFVESLILIEPQLAINKLTKDETPNYKSTKGAKFVYVLGVILFGLYMAGSYGLFYSEDEKRALDLKSEIDELYDDYTDCIDEGQSFAACGAIANKHDEKVDEYNEIIEGL